MPISKSQSNDLLCQICLESHSKLLENFCGPQCPSQLCTSCLYKSFELTLQDSIYGIVPRLKCPICLEAIQSYKWKKILNKDQRQYLLQEIEEKCNIACEIRCPACDDNCSFHGDFNPNVDTKLIISKRMFKYLPLLKRQCKLFVNHKILAKELYDWIETHFQDKSGNVIDKLMNMIPDPERRCTLISYHFHKYPKTFTTCCGEPICFRCKVSGHHENMTCQDYSSQFQRRDNQIIQCKECHIFLVKGDGCSSVRCPCGHEFLWEDRIYEMENELFALKIETILTNPKYTSIFKKILDYLKMKVTQKQWKKSFDDVLIAYKKQIQVRNIKKNEKIMENSKKIQQRMKNFQNYLIHYVWKQRFHKVILEFDKLWKRQLLWKEYWKNHPEELLEAHKEIELVLSIQID